MIYNMCKFFLFDCLIFSSDYDIADTNNILGIHKYLMKETWYKMFAFIKKMFIGLLNTCTIRSFGKSYINHYSKFSTSNIQTNCFKSISEKFGKFLNSFALIFLILVIWQFNSFCIPAFLPVIFTIVVKIVFILFIALIFNIYIKLICVIGIFINFLIHIFIIFFCIIFRIYFLTFFFLFLWSLYCIRVFLLLFYMFLVCFLLIVTIIIYQQVLLFFVFILILTKMVTAFKVIITTLWMIYGYFLQPCFFSWKFNNRSNIKLRLPVILVVSVMLFLHKHIKS